MCSIKEANETDSRPISVTTPDTTTPLGNFRKLPGELRVEIYRYALTTNKTITISRSLARDKSYVPPRFSWERKKPKTIRKSRGTVPIPHEKKKNASIKAPAAQVLAIGLLVASKAINQEATPIIYGQNRFHFENGPATKAFFAEIKSKAALLSLISIDTGRYTKWNGEHELFNRLARPKQILMNFQGSASARWPFIKKIFTTHEVLDGDGKPRVTLELPEELQRKRLDTCHFDMSFMEVQQYFMATADPDDPEELAAKRSAEYRVEMHDCLRQDAARVREEDNIKRQEISNLLAEAQTLK